MIIKVNNDIISMIVDIDVDLNLGLFLMIKNTIKIYVTNCLQKKAD